MSPCSSLSALLGLRRLVWLCCVGSALAWLAAGPVDAEEAAKAARPVTTLNAWWTATQENPVPLIDMDVTADVAFFDPHWKNLWVYEATGTGSYIAVGKNVPPLRPGLRIRLRGRFVPSTRLSTDDVTVTVLEERAVPAPQPTAGDLMNIARFQHQPVRLKGLVEFQEEVDSTHVRLHVISDEHALEVVVLVDPSDVVPVLKGAEVSVDGLYAPRYSSGGNLEGLTVWASGFRAVKVTGWLASDPRLKLPLSSLDKLEDDSAETWVRVSGRLTEVQPGKSFTLSAAGATLLVHTAQTRLPGAGSEVTVVGRLDRGANDSLVLNESIVPEVVLAAKSKAAPKSLTNLQEWWSVSASGVREPLPLDTLVDVIYFDRDWNNMWVMNGGSGYYIALGREPTRAKVGDRLRLKGTVVPRDNVSTETLEVTFVEHRTPPEPLPVAGRIREVNTFRNRRVRVEGYVDSQERADDTHLRLHFITEGMRAGVQVLVNPHESPDYAGQRVVLEGVYVPVEAPDGSLTQLSLLLPGTGDIHPLGSLDEDPRFTQPASRADRLATVPPGEWVRLAGRVRDQNLGASLVIADQHGQVFARTLQRTPLGYNDPIEIIGRVSHDMGRIILTEALFRRSDVTSDVVQTAGVVELNSAAQVIALPPAEAERALPVRLSGIVTWSHHSSRFFFVLDASRGARVHLPEGAQPPEIGRVVTVTGTTAPGAFASEVQASQLDFAGMLQSMAMPEPRTTTLEQALTGLDEASWVELGGYVKSVKAEGPWVRLELLTSGGEFCARVAATESLERVRGAFVRVRGVCTALANDRRQLTGIELWLPDAQAVQVEAPAPADPFVLPLLPLASLQQFNVLQSVNRLTRIAATVVHHIPGRLVFADDAGESIRILSTSTQPLAPGDRIEAVGLPGRANSQLVLREAVYRKTGRADEPEAMPLDAGTMLREELDGRLAHVEATLLGSVQQGADLRLMLRSESTAFDALLSGGAGNAELEPGMLLGVTGVYELIRDEYRAPRSLQLLLRGPGDVTVLRRPSWWTAGRALGVSGSLVFTLLLGLGWVRSLRRRVRAQTREIRSQLSKVEHLEARQRGIIDSASDFIFTAGLDGRLTSINPAGEELTGYSREEAMGLHLRDLIAPEDQAKGLAMLDLRSLPDGSATFQGRFRRRDGELVWVETSARLLRVDGEATGILGVVRDSTARRRHEEALTQARDSAEANARAKSTFLANMSHEIRTPMNGVIGMSNLLLDTKLEPQQHEFAETIRNSAESLLTVLNDILDFSKIEAGKLQFEFLDFDLHETVESTLELMSTRASAKGLELAVLVPSEVPDAVRGDPGRLRQVLLNLLGNAIKFTSSGEVVVRLGLLSEDAENVRVRFEVQDTGIGLTEQAQSALFQPFVQADSSTTRRFGGTGLGLAICKQIVELLGGEIGVSSEVGRGSTFWFSVPFARSTAPAALSEERVCDASELLRGVRVAIVDDNATNRSVLQHYVSGWGARCDLFADAAQALEGMRAAAAAGDGFGFALLDFQMPEMNGLMLAKEMRSDPTLRSVKSLLLTSIDQRFEPDELQACGILLKMTKPIRRTELRAAIRAAVLSGASAAPKMVKAPGAVPAPKGRSLRVLVAEDNVVNQRVARLQLEKLGHRVDLVANGVEVLDALERAPYDLILMDCQMPEMDGYEATRRIRRSTHQADILIVAMTAHAMEGDREACLAAGMNEYLSKPVRLPMLEAVLEKMDPEFTRRGAGRTHGNMPTN